ncbi:MAG: c-type cytochrome [Rhodobacteraceae bacterium]|nr:c-type cytochrome [Paracoccaceae bacterium]
MRRILLLASLAMAGPVAADGVENGHELYMSRCAACHGEKAHGDGPMAALLTIPVADLATLSARNGGVFPRVDVVLTIDGRMTLRGHGGEGPMPVFGPILGGGSAVLDGPDDTIVETRGDVIDIALYLETIQGEGN